MQDETDPTGGPTEPTTIDRPTIEVVAQFANVASVGFTQNEFLFHFGVAQGGKTQHAVSLGVTPQFAQQFSRALSEAVAKYRVNYGSIVEGGLIVPARGR